MKNFQDVLPINGSRHCSGHCFSGSFEKPPKSLILDFDATDIPLYGEQQGRFFHGYYDHHCYLPLYVFCDDFPLLTRLRPASVDACASTEEILKKLVKAIRTRFPDVRIIFRGDSRVLPGQHSD